MSGDVGVVVVDDDVGDGGDDWLAAVAVEDVVFDDIVGGDVVVAVAAVLRLLVAVFLVCVVGIVVVGHWRTCKCNDCMCVRLRLTWN